MEDYKAKTIASYNKHAVYHAKRFSGLFDTTKRTEFDTFLELLPGKKILDIGCGAGENARYFIEQGFEVEPIDLSESMVSLSLKNGINAKVMDLEMMTFSPESFDGIWAVTSLLHVPKKNMPSVVKQLYALLKSQGILYVCVKEGEGEVMVPDQMDETERFFAYWHADELRNLFESQFTTVNFKREIVGSRTFLMFFFKK